MRELYKESKHTTWQINSVSFKIKWTSKKNKQKDKKVSPKIHKSLIRRLRQVTLNTGIRIQYKITKRIKLFSLLNSIRENI